MIRIVSDSNEPVVTVNKITNHDKVGLVIGNEKYIIIYRKISVTGYCYSRLGQNLFNIGDGYSSIVSLLKGVKYDDAYRFESNEELMSWFISNN